MVQCRHAGMRPWKLPDTHPDQLPRRAPRWPELVGAAATVMLLVCAPAFLVLLAMDSNPPPPSPHESTGLVPDHGAVLPGKPTQEAFHGRPAGIDPATCAAAWQPRYLAPGFHYDPAANRTRLLDLPITLDSHLPPLDWVALDFLTQRYYGVHLVQNASGIPIEYDPPDPAAINASVFQVSAELVPGLVMTTAPGARLLVPGSYMIQVHTNVSIELALLHEFGHSLGLGHSSAWNDIMNPLLPRAGYGLQDCQRLILSRIEPGDH
jgi:hypothetical protein